MESVDEWARDVDTETPSAARMYDYYLGGSHNFAVDREAARTVIEAIPDVPLIAQANRGFLQRAVRVLVDAGVRQFLDIGSGIPTRGNVHEIVQAVSPTARVVYVDRDPVAVAHSRQLLVDNAHAVALQADLRQPHDLIASLTDPVHGPMLDLDQPVGCLLAAMLHFLPGEEAYAAVGVVRDALPGGSYLVVSHSSVEGFGQLADDASDSALSAYRQTTTPAGLRTRPEILRFFAGFTLVEPGLVWVSQWRSEHGDEQNELFANDPRRSGMLAGVARKPAPPPVG